MSDPRRLLEIALDQTDPPGNRARAAMQLAVMMTQGAAKLLGADPSIASEPTARTYDTPMTEAKEISAKYDGVCSRCGGSYDAGDRVMWIRGQRPWHPGCDD